ncbi:MAG: hypothetical protein GY862_30335 [Gammaproteobacteria bacterium]|nr:hypothetical protein [Gammaproteobacteria bacterium]
MTIRSRITKLEGKGTPNNAALWQELKPGGGAVVFYQDGRKAEIEEPLPRVKLYIGISPADWDKEKRK